MSLTGKHQPFPYMTPIKTGGTPPTPGTSPWKGRTLSVERLPQDAVTAYGAPTAAATGYLAAVERLDGTFVQVHAWATDTDGDDGIPGLAAQIADSRTARLVDAWTGCASPASTTCLTGG